MKRLCLFFLFGLVCLFSGFAQAQAQGVAGQDEMEQKVLQVLRARDAGADYWVGTVPSNNGWWAKVYVIHPQTREMYDELSMNLGMDGQVVELPSQKPFPKPITNVPQGGISKEEAMKIAWAQKKAWDLRYERFTDEEHTGYLTVAYVDEQMQENRKKVSRAMFEETMGLRKEDVDKFLESDYYFPQWIIEFYTTENIPAYHGPRLVLTVTLLTDGTVLSVN